MKESNTIKIVGPSEASSKTETVNLVGKIVHIPAGGEIEAGGTPLFDLFRFAQVV